METVKGTVKKIIFNSDESGFKVMKVRIPSGPIITVTGEFGPDVVQGTIADFHGDYKKHYKYGTGFRVVSLSISHNVEEIHSFELFIDEIAPNIGPERAHAIVKHFGSEMTDVLNDEPERLIEVEGIGKISADSLAEAWNSNKHRWKEERQDFALRAFLNSLGVKERRVKKILGYFGGGLRAEEKIKENPYILTEVEGFGFSTADFIARKLGIPEKDPLRLVAFIQYALKVLCPSNGHLFLTLEEMLTLINNFCLNNNTKFLDRRVIGVNDIIVHIKYLLDKGKIIKDYGSLYSKQCYLSESLSASKICKIINEESDLITLDKKTIDKHIIDFELKNGLTLSNEQRKALYYFVDKKVYGITGLPGSGKTLILEAIVSLIKKLKLHLTCMAPTGISAKKMASTIGYEAYTIHRRLKFRGDSWVHGEDNKYETDVIIVDEFSMVDQEVFYRLLSAVHNRVHLIFVGDNNQLPSVGAGNVLKELINCDQIPIVKLDHIFRQEEASDIIKVAKRIKEGNTNLDLFKSDPKADVFFIREERIERIQNFLVKVAQKFKDDRKTFQIISPRNEGPLSVNELNDSLQAVLNPAVPKKKKPTVLDKLDLSELDIIDTAEPETAHSVTSDKLNSPEVDKFKITSFEEFMGRSIEEPVERLMEEPVEEYKVGKFIIRKGDRVIIIKNDYELGVFNGEVGKVLHAREGKFSIGLDDKIVQISVDDALRKIRLAYILTVHRSQGQEYPFIILPFINQYGRNMLQRNLLYTAITRAKKKVIVIGHASAIEKAINNSSVQKRNTNLGERIKLCLQKQKRDSLPILHGEPVISPCANLKEELHS